MKINSEKSYLVMHNGNFVVGIGSDLWAQFPA